jgi:hypothetical protein
MNNNVKIDGTLCKRFCYIRTATPAAIFWNGWIPIFTSILYIIKRNAATVFCIKLNSNQLYTHKKIYLLDQLFWSGIMAGKLHNIL